MMYSHADLAFPSAADFQFADDADFTTIRFYVSQISQIYTDFSSENSSRFNSKQLLRRVSSQYDIENENLEERIMAVIDYISGMTDIYALDIYQKINGISLPIV